VHCVSHHRDTADALWLLASTIALDSSLQKALQPPFQLLPQQTKASSKHHHMINTALPSLPPHLLSIEAPHAVSSITTNQVQALILHNKYFPAAAPSPAHPSTESHHAGKQVNSDQPCTNQHGPRAPQAPLHSATQPPTCTSWQSN
jgi:hypothetical protein